MGGSHKHARRALGMDAAEYLKDDARNAGATILEEPEDQFYGDRRYSAGQLKSATLPVH